MAKKLPPRNPEAAWVRDAIASRRVGVNAKCACGEARPKALIPQSNPTMCHRCERIQNGQTTMDAHHIFGKANSPVTMEEPVNDHRSELNVAQYDWPKQARENPDGSPFLAAAGRILGFIDMVVYLMEKGPRWVVDLLVAADEFLTNKLGRKWWIGTKLEKFAPKSKRTSCREPK